MGNSREVYSVVTDMMDDQEWMMAASNSELRSKWVAARERLEELTINFMNLRSGGCAMETLLDEAKREVGVLEAELVRRGDV